MQEYIYLVPLFPLIGVVINGLLLGRLPKMLVSIIGCGTVFLSFITSILLFVDLTKLDPAARVIQQTLFTWIPSGDFQVNFAFLHHP